MKIKPVVIWLMCLMYANSAFSQLINIENLRYNRKEGWQGVYSLSASVNKGSKKIIQGKTNLSFQYSTKKHTFMSFSDFGFMRVDKEKALINNGFQHFRYNYIIPFLNRVVFECFVQYQYNFVKLLKARYLGGLGPRIGIFNKDKVQLFFSPLIMYEYEMLTDNVSESKLIKWDAILAFNYSITDNIKLGTVTYYQPDILNYSDFRISSDNYIEFKIAANLSIQSVFNFNFDSKPPATVNGLFYNFSNAIKLTF